MHTCLSNIKAMIAAHTIRAAVSMRKLLPASASAFNTAPQFFYRLTKQRASHRISLILALWYEPLPLSIEARTPLFSFDAVLKLP